MVVFPICLPIVLLHQSSARLADLHSEIFASLRRPPLQSFAHKISFSPEQKWGILLVKEVFLGDEQPGESSPIG
jgi:hypothetical protein